MLRGVMSGDPLVTHPAEIRRVRPLPTPYVREENRSQTQAKHNDEHGTYSLHTDR